MSVEYRVPCHAICHLRAAGISIGILVTANTAGQVVGEAISDETDFESRVPLYRERLESLMADFVAAQTGDDRLGEATRYAAATLGKRIRPLLAYATAEAFGLAPEIADGPAVAIELVHTYSLVHDDLPAMDDDDLRRGRPTVHTQYDEAMGILVGDALLTFAFQWLSEAEVSADIRVEWIRQLSIAAGGQGMISGQATDIEGETTQLPLSTLEVMHRKKSGALIEASMIMPAAALDGTASQATSHRQALASFGHHIGLAFQIRDDILDVEATTEALGKPQGSDADNNKSTFVTLLGMSGAKQRLQQEQDKAYASLQGLGAPAEGLKWLADYIVARAF